MAKVKTAYFCKECGMDTPKWTGKCPSCGAWNSLIQEVIDHPSRKGNPFQETGAPPRQAQRLTEMEAGAPDRIEVPDAELHRVLGGGLVPGSVTLVAGEPGIGKSTLFLQVALAWKGMPILYVSGEESAHQIRLRAERLGGHQDQLFLLTATSTQTLFQEARKIKPRLMIIDSIQTMESPSIDSGAGSVSQIRETAAEIQQYAKSSGIPVILIGHITKEGTIAGPKILEHMVDTVLQFEGDRHHAYRLLRTTKNRFGSTSELGIYEMLTQGLRGVTNPSEILLSPHTEPLPGVAIGSTMEGLRPLMVEVQALVSPAVYGNPQRTISGMDPRRLQLLLAVLEKRGGFGFGNKDVYVNVAGGLKIEDPSMELALAAALLSSYEDLPLPQDLVLIGEVGLSGEIRAVHRMDQRIAEAAKMGMKEVIVPQGNQKGLSPPPRPITIRAMNRLEDLYAQLFSS